MSEDFIPSAPIVVIATPTADMTAQMTWRRRTLECMISTSKMIPQIGMIAMMVPEKAADVNTIP